MRKRNVLVFNCEPGMILAEDIISNGLKLISRNTVINSYVIDKLISLGEYNICVYVSEKDSNSNKYSIIKEDYESNIHIIKKLIDELTSTNKVDSDMIVQISESIINYLDKPNVIVKCITSLKRADEYTYTHCINVAIYSMLIAKWMGLPSDSIQKVIQCGLLHDIGKIKIDNKILNKPGKLTNDEVYEIKKHTILGYDLVNQYNDFCEDVKNTILMHHERVDGSGYPFGLFGKDIILKAKIVSVADTFDAMISDRVYKKGTTPFDAFLMFQTEGIKFYDTSVVLALLENISSYYIGMRVTFDDGKVGEIMYIPPNDILNPIVQVDGELIDFSREKNMRITNIYI